MCQRSLQVTVLDPAGRVLGQSQPITADATDLALQWKSGSSAAWKGRQVRLRIEWQQGTLFSFTGLEDR